MTRKPQEAATRRKAASPSPDKATKAPPKKPRARKSEDVAAAADALAPYESPTLSAIRRALDDMKAEEIVEIDLRGKTSLADMMIIATGRVNRHVVSIAERIAEFLKQEGRPTPRLEGLPHGDWVLIDGNDVIVHLFRPEVRAFYNLEKMWGVDRPGEGEDPARRAI